MKERIVLNESISQTIISNKESESSLYPKTIIDNAKIEQVPETFEELCELCRDLGCISFGKTGQTQDTEYIALDNRLYFYKDGTIDFGFDNLAYTITPEQMWQIIKNLVEE